VSTGRQLISGLLARERITEAQLPRIEVEVRRRRVGVRQVLLDLGFATETDLLAIEAEALGVPFVDVSRFTPEPDTVLLIPQSFARANSVLPLEDGPEGLIVALADPTDMTVTDTVQGFVRRRVSFRMGSPGEIQKRLLEYHDHYQAHAVERLLKGSKDQEVELARRIGLSTGDLREIAKEQRVVIRTLNLLLLHALIKRASDIHMEPGREELIVKYRIDGVLHTVQRFPVVMAPALSSRIKILCNLDIAERRMPQDGSFYIQVDERDISFRVATAPTVHGEKVVLRILDKQIVQLGIENLGFTADNLSRLRKIIQRPSGILLVVGPTGSGKTTTLYSILHALNTGTRNITTIEDPIEYTIAGLSQIQVNDDIGLSFSALMRAVLRQDPDVIFLGEIRDLETARSAIRASLTGHMVFSTLHTNSAAAAISRMTDLGAESFLLAAGLRGVLSQRLVRALCRQCRQPAEPDPTLLAMLPEDMRTLKTAWRARGCRQCFMTGYRGRIPLMELLVVDEVIREQIIAGASATALQETGRAAGMQGIFRDGLARVEAGITTLEELLSTIDIPEVRS
jgi:type II secretory ATPase GspE/PulE/Tfp pilus assembly ATPase PilB-like protein